MLQATKVNKNKESRQLSSGEIKAHFKALDTMQLYTENWLYKMYKSKSIDYYLYKALNLIYTYQLNGHDKRYSIVTPNKCRYHQLKRKFIHFYKLSSVKISLKLYDRIKQYIWSKVYYNEDMEGHANTSYKYTVHQQLVNLGKVNE